MSGTIEEVGEILKRQDLNDSGKTWTKPIETPHVRGTYSNLSPEELELRKADIARVEATQEKCRGCDGKICIQNPQGMIPVVASNHGKYYEAYRMCKWERTRRNHKKIQRLFSAAKVPRLYEGVSWDDYRLTDDNSEAVTAVKYIMKPGTKGLFVYGPRGTGKTMLVSILANEMTKNGQTVLFSSVPDLLEDIRESYNKKTSDKTIRAAREVSCLILDDLGAEHITEWVGSQLFSLLNHRYNERLKTIITSNYNRKELSQRLTVWDSNSQIADDTQAQRIISRINGMCDYVYLGGDDWRTCSTKY